jgi:hypothetical protein
VHVFEAVTSTCLVLDSFAQSRDGDAMGQQFHSDLRARSDVEDGDRKIQFDASQWAPAAEWMHNLKVILKHINHLINPPMATGSGHRSLSDKCAAEIFKWHVQKPDSMPLELHARSYACHCGDLGLEASTPDFVAASHESLLPTWCAPAGGADIDASDVDIAAVAFAEEDNRSDEGDIDGVCFDEAAPSLFDQVLPPYRTQQGHVHLMPNGVSIAGMQHIIDNMNAETHKGMVWWPEFLKVLKNAEALLRIDERRNRYIWTCLLGTRFEHRAGMFENFAGQFGTRQDGAK